MPLGLIDKLKPSDKENLVDYILWVGDMDFIQYPFRDADALVLCMLSYFDMKMLFEDGREEVLLKKLLPHVEYRSSLPQLTGQEVEHTQYGSGTVTAQNGAVITVQYESGAKKQKLPFVVAGGFLRLKDEETVTQLTRMDELDRQKDSMRKEIHYLESLLGDLEKE